jgi:hypothetical protein
MTNPSAFLEVRYTNCIVHLATYELQMHPDDAPRIKLASYVGYHNKLF